MNQSVSIITPSRRTRPNKLVSVHVMPAPFPIIIHQKIISQLLRSFLSHEELVQDARTHENISEDYKSKRKPKARTRHFLVRGERGQTFFFRKWGRQMSKLIRPVTSDQESTPYKKSKLKNEELLSLIS
jgi:hypothetical protein